MAVRSSKVGWRRAFTSVAASGALAAGLLIGAGAGTANADVLDDIYAQYDTGAGGGQVSNLIHDAMRMRSQGFVPSKGNMADLEEGWAKRPNQGPLVSALESTVAYMRRSQMRSQQSGPVLNPPTIGINQYQPGRVPDSDGGPSISLPIA